MIKKKYLVFTFINAFLCLILFFYIQKVFIFPSLDGEVPFITSLFERVKGERINKPSPHEILLVNTSNDNYLVDKYDEFGLPNGNMVITNRASLAKLFYRLKQHAHYKYVICDIFIEVRSPQDDSLLRHIDIPNAVFAHRNTEGKSIINQASVNFGTAAIKTIDEDFYKYQLFQEGTELPTIPVIIYEDLFQEKIEKRYLHNKVGDRYIFNEFFPKFRITSLDLQNKNYALYNLHDLLLTTDDFFINTIKDRIIVIGDFTDQDIHNTVIGDMPGPLILLNAYYSLVNNENEITIWLVLYLFIVFLVFSYIVISPHEQIEEQIRAIPYLGGILLLTSYFFAMFIISFLTYLIFDLRLNFGYIALLMFAENIILNFKSHLNKIRK